MWPQVHDALSPVPSTLPPEKRKEYQHLILATYPHGRGTFTCTLKWDSYIFTLST